jgi:hypothetical protein
MTEKTILKIHSKRDRYLQPLFAHINSFFCLLCTLLGSSVRRSSEYATRFEIGLGIAGITSSMRSWRIMAGFLYFPNITGSISPSICEVVKKPDEISEAQTACSREEWVAIICRGFARERRWKTACLLNAYGNTASVAAPPSKRKQIESQVPRTSCSWSKICIFVPRRQTFPRSLAYLNCHDKKCTFFRLARLIMACTSYLTAS